MATNRPLPSDIKVTGVDQASLVKWMQNVTDGLNDVRTAVAELRTDHAAFVTLTTANKTAVNAVITAAGSSLAAIAAVSSVTAPAVATITAGALTTTDITLLRS